jgi:hypothetical protein
MICRRSNDKFDTSWKYKSQESQGAKMKIKTHKPNTTLWLIAFLLFIYSLATIFMPLPRTGYEMVLSAALLLIGTTIV